MSALIAKLCLNGRLDELKEELDKYPSVEAKLINLRRQDCYAIHWAIVNNHLNVVKYIFELGITIDDIYRSRLKNIASLAQNGNLEMLKFLLEHGLTIDEMIIQDHDCAVIEGACKNGRLSILECLFDHGLPEYYVTDSKALALALKGNHKDVVKFLLEHFRYTDDEKSEVPEELKFLSPDLGIKSAAKVT